MDFFSIGLRLTARTLTKKLSSIFSKYFNTKEVKRVAKIVTKLTESYQHVHVKHTTNIDETSKLLTYYIGILHRIEIIDPEKNTLISNGQSSPLSPLDGVFVPDEDDHAYWEKVKYSFDVEDIEDVKEYVYEAIEETCMLLETLENQIESCYTDTYNTIVTSLQSYFEPRLSNKDLMPRIVIKQYHAETNEIRDFRRQENSILDSFNASEHKPFNDYMESGNKNTIFINDLPREVVNGSYKNKRIIKSTVNRRFKRKKTLFTQGNLFYKAWPYKLDSSKYDNAWRRCFTDGHDKSKPMSSYYKSISVTPITLDGMASSESVLSEIISPQGNLFTKRKDLLSGFLCCDHVSENFFIPELDNPVLKTTSNLFMSVWYSMMRQRELNKDYWVACSVYKAYNIMREERGSLIETAQSEKK